MACTKQRTAVRKNIQKAAPAAKKKRTIAHLPKATRTALGKGCEGRQADAGGVDCVASRATAGPSTAKIVRFASSLGMKGHGQNPQVEEMLRRKVEDGSAAPNITREERWESGSGNQAGRPSPG